jgi:hypothetical protein
VGAELRWEPAPLTVQGDPMRLHQVPANLVGNAAEASRPRRAGRVHPMRPRDTTAAAHEAQLRCYRRMSGAEKVALAAQLSEDVRAVAMAGIRARHPEYSDREARHALHRLLLGDTLFSRAWPLAPRLAP